MHNVSKIKQQRRWLSDWIIAFNSVMINTILITKAVKVKMDNLIFKLF